MLLKVQIRGKTINVIGSGWLTVFPSQAPDHDKLQLILLLYKDRDSHASETLPPANEGGEVQRAVAIKQHGCNFVSDQKHKRSAH